MLTIYVNGDIGLIRGAGGAGWGGNSMRAYKMKQGKISMNAKNLRNVEITS